MPMTLYNKLTQSWNTIRKSTFISYTNDIISSIWGVGILGILTFIAFAFSLELEFYTFVILYTIYVGIFADDFTPLMPLFILCYITPSKSNNPGMQTEGLFYGSTATYLVTIVSIGMSVLLLRIILDPKIGLRRLFTQKRALLPSMLALGVSYLLSGILHPQYAEYAKSNLLFATIQFASVLLLYFIFSVTIDWKHFDFDYFATIGLVVGFVVAAEIGFTYLTENVIVNGVIERYQIQTGWGCYNNIGALICMSIPFALYFASRKKGNAIFLAVACFFFIAVIFSASRASFLGALFAFIGSFIYTFVKSENKRAFHSASFVLFAILLVGAWVFREKLTEVFQHVPNIFSKDSDNSITIGDSGRLEYYRSGIQVYLRNPIFGQSFYPIEYELYSFSVVSDFVSFFPPRWHNTLVQMMASCGTVGMVAYLYHRFSTIKLYCKNPTKHNTYLFFHAGALVGMSLLDFHFFNVGPVLLYSMVMAVAEFAPETYEPKMVL